MMPLSTGADVLSVISAGLGGPGDSERMLSMLRTSRKSAVSSSNSTVKRSGRVSYDCCCLVSIARGEAGCGMVLLTMVNVLLAMRITRNASAWNAVDVGMLTECRGSGVRALLDV